jgi:site-specific DNA-methyltransferase (adenine-specific)
MIDKNTNVEDITSARLTQNPCYVQPFSEVFNEDCIQVMKRYPDKFFDLAVVDPPYGIEIAEWDKERPTDEYWNELWRVSKNQIVWGGNYFNLPIKRQWICWDKSAIKAGYLGKTEFDEFELAWTSFDGKCKMIRFSDIGNMNGFDGKLKVDYTFKGKIHPCQKHIKIYDWILQNYANEGNLILDTHLGSGSSRIAAHKAGLSFIGCEIDKDYFEAQEKRFKEFASQLRLF